MYLNIAIGLVVFTFVVLSTIYYDFFGLGDEAYYLAMGLLFTGMAVTVLLHVFVRVFGIISWFKNRGNPPETTASEAPVVPPVDPEVAAAEDRKGNHFIFGLFAIMVIIIVVVLTALDKAAACPNVSICS